MSTFNICFLRRNKKIINFFHLKKMPCLELSLRDIMVVFN